MTKIFRIVASLLFLLCLLFASDAHAQSEDAPKFAFVRDLHQHRKPSGPTIIAPGSPIISSIRCGDRADKHRDDQRVRDRSEHRRNSADYGQRQAPPRDPGAGSLEKTFENWQGMMVGDGSHNMWLRCESGEGDNLRYQIVTINDMPLQRGRRGEQPAAGSIAESAGDIRGAAWRPSRSVTRPGAGARSEASGDPGWISNPATMPCLGRRLALIQLSWGLYAQTYIAACGPARQFEIGQEPINQ